MILKLFHLSAGWKVRLLAVLQAAFPEWVQVHSAIGSSGHALSRATSLPAVDRNGGCEQAPKASRAKDIFLVS